MSLLYLFLNTDISLEFENEHIQRRSAQNNKLMLDNAETKEVVFKRPSLRKYVPPSHFAQIQQLSASVHITFLIGINACMLTC